MSVARRLEAAVDEDRADQRFADVGEDRRLLAPAAARFAEAQHDMRPDVPLGGDLGAGLAAHELGEPHRQLALARLRERRGRAGSATTTPSTRSPRNSSRW